SLDGQRSVSSRVSAASVDSPRAIPTHYVRGASRRGLAPLHVAHRQDFVLAHARRGLDLRGVADVLADQGTGDRRADRDLGGLDVGLVVADDLIADLVA